MSVLSKEQIQVTLRRLSGWSLEDGAIAREYRFPGFPAALAFVNRVAERAESAGHHPDIEIRYNKVKLTLVSHDAGGVTERDVRMAQTLNAMDAVDSTNLSGQ